MRHAVVFGAVAALLAATTPAAAQVDAEAEVVPPPPPPSSPPPPAVAYAPARAPAPPPPQPMSPAAPFMLGFGTTVLGGLSFGALTAWLADADHSTIDAEGGLALGAAYLVSAVLLGVGAYLGIGSLIGEVEVYSDDPGWIWFSAVTSMAGGATTLAAVITWFVDDDFGDDSIGLTIAAATLYALSATALFGVDDAGSTTVSLAPTPLDGGGGLWLTGRY